ncbi:MAG: DUF6966 domain-containing protein [Candidatus Hodarchaeales archaeon]
MTLDYYLDALKALEALLTRNNWPHWRDTIRNHIAFWEKQQLSELHRSIYGGMGSFNDISLSHTLENHYFMYIKSIAYSLAVKPNFIDPTEIGNHLGSIGNFLSAWMCGNGHDETFQSNIQNFVAAHLAREDVIAYYAGAKLYELVKDRQSGSFLVYEDRCLEVTEIVKSSGIKVTVPDKKIRPCTICGDHNLTHHYWALDDEGKRFVKVNHGVIEIPQNIRDVFK